MNIYLICYHRIGAEHLWKLKIFGRPTNDCAKCTCTSWCHVHGQWPWTGVIVWNTCLISGQSGHTWPRPKFSTINKNACDGRQIEQRAMSIVMPALCGRRMCPAPGVFFGKPMRCHGPWGFFSGSKTFKLKVFGEKPFPEVSCTPSR
jgi:hypothetical protein